MEEKKNYDKFEEEVSNVITNEGMSRIDKGLKTASSSSIMTNNSPEDFKMPTEMETTKIKEEKPIQKLKELKLTNEIKEKIKKTKFTFGYTIINILISFIYVLYSARIYDSSDYSLSTFPLKYKNQLYRIITNSFIHLNFVHFVIIIGISYLKLPNIEKKMGTINFLIYLNLCIYFHGFFYIGLIGFEEIIWNKILGIKDIGFNFEATIGFSGIFFAYYYLDCINEADQTEVIYQVEIIKKFKPFYMIFALKILNPKFSLLSNYCGILASKILMTTILFPSIKSVKSFENFLSPFISKLLGSNYVPVCYLSKNNILDNLKIKIDEGEI